MTLQLPAVPEDSDEAYGAFGGWAVIVTHTVRQASRAEVSPSSHAQLISALSTAALGRWAIGTVPGVARPALRVTSASDGLQGPRLVHKASNTHAALPPAWFQRSVASAGPADGWPQNAAR